MTKEAELKKLGWKIEAFQPKGEKYPWCLKISKAVATRGLHSDAVTDKIRCANGRYVITAYLDPNKKLDSKTKEARIVSALKWELTKNFALLDKYVWLKELENVCGKVKPIVFQRQKHKAVFKNFNETVVEEEKAKEAKTEAKEKPSESQSAETVKQSQQSLKTVKKKSTSKTVEKAREPSKPKTRKTVSKVETKKVAKPVKLTKASKKTATIEKSNNKAVARNSARTKTKSAKVTKPKKSVSNTKPVVKKKKPKQKGISKGK